MRSEAYLKFVERCIHYEKFPITDETQQHLCVHVVSFFEFGNFFQPKNGSLGEKCPYQPFLGRKKLFGRFTRKIQLECFLLQEVATMKSPML